MTKCNRTACTNEQQLWWNLYTHAYYCQPCAFRINDSSNQSSGRPICVRHRRYSVTLAGGGHASVIAIDPIDAARIAEEALSGFGTAVTVKEVIA